MRITYLCCTLGLPDQDRIRALAAAGHDIRWIDWHESATEYKWRLSDDTDRTSRTILVQSGSMLSGVAGAWRAFWLAYSDNADLYLVYGYQKLSIFLVATILCLLGKRLVSMNDSQFNDYQRNIVTDSAKLVMLAPYYGFLAGSERAAIYLKYLGRARVAIYHCAIDTERVGRLSAPHFEATAFADRHFVMIGRFIEKKNHKLLLQAFESYLETATAKRRLILVGYGPLENDIKARISSSPLLQQFVDLRGYMEPDDIAALLGSALALYLPSFEEQFGIVVTEALAAGIPVVVTHACGAAELVQTAVNGFIVEPNNLHALSWTMEEISSDEAFWSMLSSNTRMYAKSGDVKLFVEAAEAMAGDVISTT